MPTAPNGYVLRFLVKFSKKYDSLIVTLFFIFWYLISEIQNAFQFLNFQALKWYKARRSKNHFVGQLLYKNPDPAKKRRHSQHTPQDFVTNLSDDLIRRNLFAPELEFRISMVGFADEVVQHISMSEFNFVGSRNAEYARQRIVQGLEFLGTS